MSLISNPNLLDNWYFVDPINQRGQMEYASPGYTIDRWKLTVNGLGFSLKLLDEGIKMSFTKDGIIVDMNHIFETPFNATDTVTFSAIIARELYSVTTTLDTSRITPLGGTGISVITGPYSTALRFTNSDNPIISAVKQELGSVQTLAHKDASGNWVLNDKPDYVLELETCQRHQVIDNNENGFIGKTESTDSNLTLFIPTAIQMRANPVVSIRQLQLSIGTGVGATAWNIKTSGIATPAGIRLPVSLETGSALGAHTNLFCFAPQGYSIDANL